MMPYKSTKAAIHYFDADTDFLSVVMQGDTLALLYTHNANFSHNQLL